MQRHTYDEAVIKEMFNISKIKKRLQSLFKGVKGLPLWQEFFGLAFLKRKTDVGEGILAYSSYKTK